MQCAPRIEARVLGGSEALERRLAEITVSGAGLHVRRQRSVRPDGRGGRRHRERVTRRHRPAAPWPTACVVARVAPPPRAAARPCVPASTIRPSRAPRSCRRSAIVDSRCAMMIVVAPAHQPLQRLEQRAPRSRASRALVGSSRIRIGASLSSARAIDEPLPLAARQRRAALADARCRSPRAGA